jgi:hypothetical protein
LRFEELAEQPFMEAFVIVFVIVFEILLEAASSPPGKPSSVPVLHSKQKLCILGKVFQEHSGHFG